MRIDYKNFAKHLNPLYYNKLSKILICSALVLISTPLWEEIIRSFLKRIGLGISKVEHPYIGFVIILVTLLFNYLSQILTINHINKQRSQPLNVRILCVELDNFLTFCQSLETILSDNKYIFKTFGPNSSMHDLEPLRTDLTLWHEAREEYIIPNNHTISCLIDLNRKHIPLIHKPLFEKLQAHIYAFEKHVQDPTFDYTAYQFPLEIERIIKDYCYERNTNDKSFLRIKDWIYNKVVFDGLKEKRIFGSTLFTVDNNNDVDLVVLISENNILETQKEVRSLEFQFLIKFKKNIHIQIFSTNQSIVYEEFVDKNPYNLLIHGKRFTLFNFTFH